MAVCCKALTHAAPPSAARNNGWLPPPAVAPLLPVQPGGAGASRDVPALWRSGGAPLLRSLHPCLCQFALAWLGTASLQKGPLWWCSHHRHHHRTADTKADAHSPVAHGFWWSHCGWFLLTDRHTQPLLRAVPDLAALPEIAWLERNYLLPPAALAAALAASGGARAVAYGFVVATVLCWHATYAINSVAHLLGGQRFQCQFNGACTARNNLCVGMRVRCAMLADPCAQAACAAHPGRGLAQQPPPIHGLRAARLRAALGA